MNDCTKCTPAVITPLIQLFSFRVMEKISLQQHCTLSTHQAISPNFNDGSKNLQNYIRPLKCWKIISHFLAHSTFNHASVNSNCRMTPKEAGAPITNHTPSEFLKFQPMKFLHTIILSRTLSDFGHRSNELMLGQLVVPIEAISRSRRLNNTSFFAQIEFPI